MIQFSEEAMREYQEILSHYPEKRAAVIPVLTLAQREFGWISQEVAEYVGNLMGYPASDMKSVSSFYVLLRQKPVWRKILMNILFQSGDLTELAEKAEAAAEQ